MHLFWIHRHILLYILYAVLHLAGRFIYTVFPENRIHDLAVASTMFHRENSRAPQKQNDI